MKLAAHIAAVMLGVGVAQAAPESPDDAMGRRVQVLLRAHQAEVFGCVSKQADAVAGEALLRVVVGGRGEASRVEVLKIEAQAGPVRAVADCVADSARRWDYRALGAAEGDQVVFPLAFRPEPQAKKAGTDASAIGARMELVTLRANMARELQLEHTAALYVVGPGAPTVKGPEGAPVRAAVGDVLLVGPGTSLKLSSTAASALLRIDSTGEPEGSPGLRRIEGAHLKAYALPRGEVRLYLDGLPAPFAVDRLCAPAGTEVPKHEHTSDELVYVLSGRATTTVQDQVIAQKPGDAVTIPRSTPHSLRVDQDLCAVQVYAPAGPEQRFKNPPRQGP